MQAIFVGKSSNEVDAIHTEQTAVPEQLAQLRTQVYLVYLAKQEELQVKDGQTWDEWAAAAGITATRSVFSLADRLPICQKIWPEVFINTTVAQIEQWREEKDKKYTECTNTYPWFRAALISEDLWRLFQRTVKKLTAIQLQAYEAAHDKELRQAL